MILSASSLSWLTGPYSLVLTLIEPLQDSKTTVTGVAVTDSDGSIFTLNFFSDIFGWVGKLFIMNNYSPR